MNTSLIEKKIYEKWSPKLKERYKEKGVLDRLNEEKLRKIAKMCHVRKIYEGTGVAAPSNVPGNGPFSFGNNPAVSGDNAKGSGDVFQNLWGVFLDVAATTFGLDLMPNLVMSKSHLTVFIAEPIYTDGKLTSASEPPTIFMVKATKTGTPTALVVGTTYTVTESFGGDNVIDITFIGFDRVKGYYVFKTGQQYDNSPATNYQTQTIAQCLTGGNNLYQSALNIYDFDGTTVDYVSGYNNFVSGYAGAGSTDTGNWYMNRNQGTFVWNRPMNRETGEGNQTRSIGLRKWNKNFEAQTFHTDVEYTVEQIQDMKMDHDVDALELGTAAAQDLLSQHLNEDILGNIFGFGWSNHYAMNQINGFNLNAALSTTTGNPVTHYDKDGNLQTIAGAPGSLPSSGAISENLSSLQRRVVSRISYGSGVVGARCRRGKGDTMVSNTTIVAAIKDIRGYTPAVFENDINTDGLYLAGSFNGIQVYEDNLMEMADNRIAIFRKGKDKDPGLKFCSYLLAEKFSTVAERTMAPKEMIKTRYRIADTGSAPELNYMTLFIEEATGYKIV